MRFIFNKIFGKLLCCHKWSMYRTNAIMGAFEKPIEIRETLICKKCGKIKQITL
jgi:hypothetical protein